MNQQRSLSLNFPQNRDSFSGRDSYRHRQILLNKVKNYWIEGVLEKSLATVATIELGLEERLDAVEGPFRKAWETTSHARKKLAKRMRVIDKFDRMGEGRSLLILGEPGSGKTTTLLEVARELIARAQQDITYKIPVVLNLSSFFEISEEIKPEQVIYRWIVEELESQYQVPKNISQTWIEQQQLLLLLDGLDEVVEEERQLCVKALNEFGRVWGRTETIVCSRTREYEVLSERLRLQGAICLQPLTAEQVDRYLSAAIYLQPEIPEEVDGYFDRAEQQMTALINLLEKDPLLQELTKTPLMLNIIVLAYQGMSAEDLSEQEGKFTSIEQTRKQIFNAYIQRMFFRRGSVQPYSQKQCLQWLSELALRMSRESQTVFLIERIQPSWLQINLKNKFRLPWQKSRKQKTKSYQAYATGVQLLTGSIWGLICLFSFLLAGSPSNFVIGGILAGIFGAALTKIEPIKPVENLKWSWIEVQKWLPVGLLLGTGGFLSAGISWGLFLGLSGVTIAGLIEEEVPDKTIPNQGIWQSAKKAVSFGVGGSILCLVGGAGLEGSIALPYVLSMSIFGSGIVGLILGLLKGGQTCIQHSVVRLMLYLDGAIPWNYSRFLNYAAERNLLQKVGGGYIFIHRLLQEHFVALAREKYQQNIEITTTDAESYLERANTKASLGDAKGAIVDYDKAIAINRHLAHAYAGRSIARYMLGDYQGLLDDYYQTYDLNPQLAQSISYTAVNSTELPQQEATTEIVSSNNPKYLLTLLNDDSNSFDLVCRCLMKYIPDMSLDRARKLAEKVHTEGQAVIWSGTEHLAEVYRTQLIQAGLSLDLCWPDVEEMQENK